jgi:hypothetical protein
MLLQQYLLNHIHLTCLLLLPRRKYSDFAAIIASTHIFVLIFDIYMPTISTTLDVSVVLPGNFPLICCGISTIGNLLRKHRKRQGFTQLRAALVSTQIIPTCLPILDLHIFIRGFVLFLVLFLVLVRVLMLPQLQLLLPPFFLALCRKVQLRIAAMVCLCCCIVCPCCIVLVVKGPKGATLVVVVDSNHPLLTYLADSSVL